MILLPYDAEGMHIKYVLQMMHFDFLVTDSVERRDAICSELIWPSHEHQFHSIKKGSLLAKS